MCLVIPCLLNPLGRRTKSTQQISSSSSSSYSHSSSSSTSSSSSLSSYFSSSSSNSSKSSKSSSSSSYHDYFYIVKIKDTAHKDIDEDLKNNSLPNPHTLGDRGYNVIKLLTDDFKPNYIFEIDLKATIRYWVDEYDPIKDEWNYYQKDEKVIVWGQRTETVVAGPYNTEQEAREEMQRKYNPVFSSYQRNGEDAHIQLDVG